MLPLTRGFGASVDSSVSSQWLRFCDDIFQKKGNEKILDFFKIIEFLCGNKNVVRVLTLNSNPIADGLKLSY